MVNVPGRSRGCYECRQRRTKCDEAHPECEKCVKKGLRCSGARTGAVFVHALSCPPKQPVARRIPLNANNHTVRGDMSLTTGDKYQSFLLYQQPSRADIFDNLFVSHFIESFGFKPSTTARQPPTWLDQLSTMIASPSPNLVKHSIRAASMYFYGTSAQDISIETESRRWYSTALQGLQHRLSQKNTGFTGNDICATVMLTHFENLEGSYAGWMQHVQGAGVMLEACGPGACREGFLHQIFRHLRLLSFAAAIMSSEQHAFASLAWIKIPFEVHPKTAFDQFVDILLSILPCLSMAERIIETADVDEQHELPGQKLSTAIAGLMSQLHAWWKSCISLSGPLEADAVHWQHAENISTMDQFSDPTHFPLLPYFDMPTAALGSLYDAANIVVLQLLHLVPPCANLYEERIWRHVQSILSAKDFIAAIPSPVSARGSLMVDLPLKILDVWTQYGPEKPHYTDQWAPSLDHSSTDAPSNFFGHVSYYIHRRKTQIIIDNEDL